MTRYSVWDRKSLQHFVANNFPLNSAEFDVGTTTYRDYVSAIDKVAITYCIVSTRLQWLYVLVDL